jgi:hypothetical protein
MLIRETLLAAVVALVMGSTTEVSGQSLDQLSEINQKISNLDGRIDELYKKLSEITKRVEEIGKGQQKIADTSEDKLHDLSDLTNRVNRLAAILETRAPTPPPPSPPPPSPPLPSPPLPSPTREEVLPSRMFAGPKQYPPSKFKAYGIVAFPARPSPDDAPRYKLICDAYVSALPHYTDVRAPFSEQMVTVWPIDTDREATRINRIPRDSVCGPAVPNYGLPIAQHAIQEARMNKAVLDGRGPFLLAWAPGSKKGQPNAPVLVSNLSNVSNIEDAKAVFTQWVTDIQDDRSLWDNGWNRTKLEVIIRLWIDRYGSDIIKYFKG